MATKTVTVVVQTYANAAGQTMTSRWNSDDGALAYYTGPGPGWELVSQEMVEEQQQDYGSYDTFSTIYGEALADAGVAAGDVRPYEPPTTNIPGSTIPVQDSSHPVGPFGSPLTTPAVVIGGGPFGSNTTALKQNPVLFIGVIVLVLWALRG